MKCCSSLARGRRGWKRRRYSGKGLRGNFFRYLCRMFHALILVLEVDWADRRSALCAHIWPVLIESILKGVDCKELTTSAGSRLHSFTTRMLKNFCLAVVLLLSCISVWTTWDVERTSHIIAVFYYCICFMFCDACGNEYGGWWWFSFAARQHGRDRWRRNTETHWQNTCILSVRPIIGLRYQRRTVIEALVILQLTKTLKT